MKYAGFYINLDRNPERRAGIEAELARNNLSGYQRFRASDGNEMGFPNPHDKPGQLGCFTSHYRVLAENRHSTLPLHVIEDDILLSPYVESTLDQAIGDPKFACYDIVYTDVAVPLFNNLFQSYKRFYDQNVKRNKAGQIEERKFTLLGLAGVPFASTCSFLINPGSIGKLADLYEAELKKGITMPVDLFIRQLSDNRAINAVTIFPFVTSINPESCFGTNMEARYDDLSVLAGGVLRYSFFVDADLPKTLAMAQKFFPQPAADDTHRQLMLRLLGFSITA